jgi:glyoxylase-like metal-dependent hydrolase (beta-lactamase superfamily II)
VRFRDLPGDLRVLPSHDWPFVGLHARLDQLARHHDERLDLLRRARLEDGTAVEAMAFLFPRALDRHQTGFALGETLAHLNYLVQRIEAARWTDADDLYRFTVK